MDLKPIINGKVDATEIENLREAIGWDRQEGKYKKILEKAYAHYILRDKEKLIGFMLIISDGIADAFFIDLIVHPDYQSQGIGSSIVKQGIKDIKTAGIKCIQITFEEKLEGFYKKLGFHIFKGGIIDFENMKIEL